MVNIYDCREMLENDYFRLKLSLFKFPYISFHTNIINQKLHLL